MQMMQIGEVITAVRKKVQIPIDGLARVLNNLSLWK